MLLKRKLPAAVWLVVFVAVCYIAPLALTLRTSGCCKASCCCRHGRGRASYWSAGPDCAAGCRIPVKIRSPQAPLFTPERAAGPNPPSTRESASDRTARVPATLFLPDLYQRPPPSC